MHPMADFRPDPKEFGRLISMAQVGLEMVFVIVIGLVIDHYAGTEPWGLILGAVIGLVGGLAHLIVLSKQPPRK
jgi:F0F1-type ATP synthase assembly protein I